VRKFSHSCIGMIDSAIVRKNKGDYVTSSGHVPTDRKKSAEGRRKEKAMHGEMAARPSTVSVLIKRGLTRRRHCRQQRRAILRQRASAFVASSTTQSK